MIRNSVALIAVVLVLLITAACGSDAEGMVSGGKPPATEPTASPKGELWYTEEPDIINASIDRPQSWKSEAGENDSVVIISPPDASPNVFHVRFGSLKWDTVACDWEDMYNQGSTLEQWLTCYQDDALTTAVLSRRVNSRGNIQIVEGHWTHKEGEFLIAYIAAKSAAGLNIVVEARFEGIPGSLEKYEDVISRMADSLQAPPTQ